MEELEDNNTTRLVYVSKGDNEVVANLKACVSHLLENNSQLCLTITELENETRTRVEAIEAFLERTAQTAKAYMVGLRNYEEFVKNLIKNKLASFNQVKKLQQKCVELTEEKWYLQDQNNNLSHDIASLVRLMSHARNTGHWDIGNIEFCDVSVDEVFGSVDRFSNRLGLEERSLQCESPSAMSTCSGFEEFGIRRLFGDSQGSTCSYSLVNSQTGGRLSGQDALVQRLQIHCKQSQQIINEIQLQLTERDQTIADLQVQIADIRHEMYVKDTEHFQYRQLLLKRDDLHTSSAKQNSFLSYDQHVGAVSKAASNSVRNTEAVQVFETFERLQLIEGNFNKLMSEGVSLNEFRTLGQRQETRSARNIDVNLEDTEAVIAKIQHNKPQQLNGAIEGRDWDGTSALNCLEVRDVVSQTDHNTRDVEEEKYLKDQEENYRSKVVALENIIQQLQEELSNRDGCERILRSKIAECTISEEKLQREVKVLTSKIADLEMTVLKQKSEIQAALNVVNRKSSEIEQQQQTIGNLREAIVALKNHGPAGQIVIDNGDSVVTGSKPANISGSLHHGKSGEILHI